MKIVNKKLPDPGPYPSTVESEIQKPFDISSAFDGSLSSYMGSSNNASDMDRSHQYLGDYLPSFSTKRSNSVASTKSDQNQVIYLLHLYQY